MTLSTRQFGWVLLAIGIFLLGAWGRSLWLDWSATALEVAYRAGQEAAFEECCSNVCAADESLGVYQNRGCYCIVPADGQSLPLPGRP